MASQRVLIITQTQRHERMLNALLSDLHIPASDIALNQRAAN